MATSKIKKIKLAVIIFYMALFTGLALYDEKPNSEMVKEMSHPCPEVVEPGNAWIVFGGFTSPEGISPFVYGKEKILKVKNLLLSGKNAGEIITSFAENKPGLSFKGEVPSFYGANDKGMLSYAAAHQEEIASLLRDNKELIRRYESLRTYPRFIEPIDDSFFMPSPSYSTIRSIQRLKLLQLALRATKGDIEEALAELRADMEFWRFISSNSTTLISRLISVPLLTMDIWLAAEVGSYHHLNDREMENMRHILGPFDHGEIALAKVMMGEFRFGQKVLEFSKRQKSPILERFVFKRTSTSNRMYTVCQDYIHFSELSPQKYAIEVVRREKDSDYSYRIGLPFLYNPAGEILAAMAHGTYSPIYIERGHNLEGLRRLALLKVLIGQENVSRERIQEFLDAHASDLGNPYTGGPMKWDPKKESISFKQLSGDKSVEIFL